MKFLLINPYMDFQSKVVKETFAIESEIPPLGLLYLAGSLQKEGHDVEIVDFCIEKFTLERLNKSLNSCDAVGITTRTN